MVTRKEGNAMGDDFTTSDGAGYSGDDPGPSAEGADYGQQFYADGDTSPATIPVAPPNDDGSSEAFVATVWDVGGALPFVGTPISAVSTAIDIGAAGLSLAEGDTSHALRKIEDAGLDAIGILPGVGNVVSGMEAVNDGIATYRRGEGETNEDAPTISDVWSGMVEAPPLLPPDPPDL
jgi:hypothetical protein